MRFIVKNLMLFEAFGISVHPQSGSSDREFRKLPGDCHFEVLINFLSLAELNKFFNTFFNKFIKLKNFLARGRKSTGKTLGQ